MTDKSNPVADGGQAFPIPAGEFRDEQSRLRYNTPRAGMSLRDYFAGQALAGMFASPDWAETPAEYMAEQAYDHADAMLRARGGA